MPRRHRTLILTYHRVNAGRDPLLQCVHPERFEAQIAALVRRFEVVPLGQARDGGSNGPCVVVTFDDGYADTARVAVPILSAYDVPAAVFVLAPTGAGVPERWWDQLEHAVLDSRSDRPWLEVEIDGRRLAVDVRSNQGRLRALKALNRRLRRLPPAKIASTIAAVREQLGAPAPGECTVHAHLELQDLANLAANPLIEVGSHGSTHAMLGVLSDHEQRAEIEGSRDWLAAAVGKTPTIFAYPFGTPDSIGLLTPRLVARAGFRLACMNTFGIVTSRSHPYRLPRMMVYDWDGPDFVSHVAAAFGTAADEVPV